MAVHPPQERLAGNNSFLCMELLFHAGENKVSRK